MAPDGSALVPRKPTTPRPVGRGVAGGFGTVSTPGSWGADGSKRNADPAHVGQAADVLRTSGCHSSSPAEGPDVQARVHGQWRPAAPWSVGRETLPWGQPSNHPLGGTRRSALSAERKSGFIPAQTPRLLIDQRPLRRQRFFPAISPILRRPLSHSSDCAARTVRSDAGPLTNGQLGGLGAVVSVPLLP